VALLGGSLSAFYCPLLRIFQGFQISVLSMYLAKYIVIIKLAQDSEARLYQNPDFLARYFCSGVFIPDKTSEIKSLLLSTTVIMIRNPMSCFAIGIIK